MSLYDDWGRSSRSEEIRKLTMGWVTVFAIMIISLAFIKISEEISRGWIAVWFVTGWSWLVAGRFAVRKIETMAYRKGIGLRKILLVGKQDLCERAAKTLKQSESHAYLVNDILIPDNTREKLNEIAARVDASPVDEVWIALPLKDEECLRAIIHALRNTAVDIRYIPDIYGMRLLNHSLASVAGLSVMNLSVSPMAGMNWLIKKVEDYVVALLIVVLISPLLLVIALLVKASSPGPVLYRQTRVSWNGQPFTMYKFRSMPVDVESQSGPKWAKAGESRATKVGAFLRKTSLDELPQFFNVLKGDMSIVGPRPERPEFVEQFKDNIQDYMKKHLVKAGITGWAQINGLRGDTDLQKRIEYDLFYIEHWSLWFDLEIIFLTLFKGFVHKNAY